MRNVTAAHSGLLRLLHLGTLATALVLSAHVESAAGLQAGKQSWTTVPDYRVYDPAATDSGFGRFSRMRLGENGTRIVVKHAGIVGVTPVWEIFVFSPEGRLLSALGAADCRTDSAGP